LKGARTQRLRRALYVGRVARRSGLLRVLRELGVWGARPATRDGAVEFRRALEELGTTYIKLGQLLSSRPDLLPDVYIDELSKLVDQVPRVPFEEIRDVIHEDLPGVVFVRIDPEPVATASIAQVHTALLQSGREVIVEVRRPGIERQIDIDLSLLGSTAELLEKRSERAQLPAGARIGGRAGDSSACRAGGAVIVAALLVSSGPARTCPRPALPRVRGLLSRRCVRRLHALEDHPHPRASSSASLEEARAT
jgi:hypothetical protein